MHSNATVTICRNLQGCNFHFAITTQYGIVQAIFLQHQVKAQAERDVTHYEAEWSKLTQLIEQDRKQRVGCSLRCCSVSKFLKLLFFCSSCKFHQFLIARLPCLQEELRARELQKREKQMVALFKQDFQIKRRRYDGILISCNRNQYELQLFMTSFSNKS